MSNTKPWDTLDPRDLGGDNCEKWWLACNNDVSYTFKDTKFDNIEAMFIIQDCNMAGKYFRYFYWYNDSEKRNCVITSEWLFNDTLDQFTNNKIIEKDNIKFIVNNKFNNKYVKILNKIN